MKNYCIFLFFKGNKSLLGFLMQVPLTMTLVIFMLCAFSGTVYSVEANSQSSNLNIEARTAKKEMNEIASNNSTQQQKVTITGLVTDSDGNPLIGVTVVQQGTAVGVITDIDGCYSIQASVGKFLEFTYIGFNKEERKVESAKTKVNVRMLVSSESLEEVVVVGYGQQKKESLVASVNSITSKELSMPNRNLTNNLAGQISGVIAIQRSGEPGRDDSSFWIRGVSSFAGGTTPLILVDGVPRAMKDISVDEIETFTVLKDASATAVYGAEGANGVVLITSKRGVSQKPTLNVRAEFGMVTPTRLPVMMDSYNWTRMYNEASWNDLGNPMTGFTNPYTDEMMNMYLTGADPDLYPNTDFLRLLQDHTFNQRVTLNLRGGSDRVRYFVSGSFYNESGIFDSKAVDKYDANIGLSRYNIRSNIDIDVTKTTKLAVDISGQYLMSQYPGKTTDEIFRCIIAFAPNLFPLRFSNGMISEHPNYSSNGVNQNPYNMLNESGYTKTWSSALQTGITLDQDLKFITKGLSLKLKGSFDTDFAATSARTKTPKSYMLRLNEQGEKEYILLNEGQPNLTNLVNSGSSGTKKIYIETSLNYKRTFSGLHDVTGMLLYMQKETAGQANPLPYRKQSIVARATYGYNNRYMLETSFGLTGSENFAEGYRWGIFPSIGGAWYVSNESFMKGVEDYISKLKVRISYGLTGNDNVGGSRFPYRATFGMGAASYQFGFTGGAGSGGTNSPGAGIVEGLFGAPYLTWEIEEKKNIGIDFGLFRGRVDMCLDIFRNDRRDILIQRKVISSTPGFRQNPWQNFGKVTNKGLDGNIVIKQNINKVNLSFRGNLTYAHNEILEYDELATNYEYQRYTGHSLGTPILFISEGLYQDSDFDIVSAANGSKTYTLKENLPKPAAPVRPGDIKYKDLSGDGLIDNYDKTYDHEFKSPNPEWVYGFGLNAEWKGFYAAIFFQGVANTSINLASNATTFIPFQTPILNTSIRKEAVSHWRAEDPTNQDVLYPRLHKGQFSHNNELSTWWYRKGDFLRLKNLEFGYQFTKTQLSKFGMKNVRIYIQGNNLAVWDEIKMWDPELGNASSGAKYPINRTWTLGLEIGF